MADVMLRGNNIREAYADWLYGYNWDYFFTATFRVGNKSVPSSDVTVYDASTMQVKRIEPIEAKGSRIGGHARRHPDAAINDVWDELAWQGAKRAFIVAEPHQSGDLHTHGIMAGGLPQQRPINLPWDIWQGLFNRFGRAKVESPRQGEAVSMYCAKYLLKQQHRACDYYAVLGDKVYWRAGRIDKPALERAAIAAGAEYAIPYDARDVYFEAK